MTWRETFRHRSPLARRLIVWTVLFSSVITLTLTLFQLYRDYRLDVSTIENHLNQIERVHLPAIAESLWTTDQSRLRLQLEGILRLSDMHFIELRENEYVWASAGRLESTNVIRRQIPVSYTNEGRQQILGTLTVVATLDGVYERLLGKAVTILVSNAIKTFLVAIFILMLFHQLVTRHLQRMGQWLNRLEKDSPPLTLANAASASEDDEINALARTLNEFRDAQAQALKAISIEHKRYESLFDNANDSIFLAEVGSWRILDANRRASEHTGFTREELRSMTLLQLGPPESVHAAAATLRRLNINGSAVFERSYRRKDGSLFPVEVSGRVINLGDARVIESFVRDLTERYRSERVLRERDEILRLFVEHSPAAIAMLDNEMCYVAVSRRWMIDYGLGDRDIIVGRSHYEIFPEIPQRWRDIHQRCLAGATERCDEDPFLRADGQTDWVKWEICPWRRADGGIAGIIVFSELVTERKQAEQALRESEERLRLALDAAHMGIFDWDIPSDRITWSRWHEELWGFKPGEFGGTYEAFAQRVHPDDLPGIDAEVARCIAARAPFMHEFRVVWPDGSARWVTGRGEFTLGADGQPLRMRGAVVEITERKQAEEALRETQRTLATLVGNLPGAVFRCQNDKDWTTSYVSDGILPLTGYSRSDLTEGKVHMGALIHPDDAESVRSTIQTALQEKRNYQVAYRIHTAAGEEKWILEYGLGIFSISGELLFLEGFVTDITERKQAEAEREKLLIELTTRNMEMENFVYTISHDLKAPLITIGGFASLLKKDLTRTDLATAHDSLAEIKKAVTQMQSHIEDLLMLSRTGRVVADKTHVDLGELIGFVLKLFTHQIGETQARIHVANDLPVILADAKGLRRVFSNLIDNALKYRRENVSPVIDIGVRRTADKTQIFVRDNGTGIRARYRQRIFELFQRADSKTEGNGVGLAIARRVVEAQGGRLWVESETGQGSTFWIELPASVIVSASSKSA